MNSKDMINELRALSADKIASKANEVAEEMMKLRFRKKTGQLSQSHHLSRVRKELARVLTVQNEKRVGAQTESTPKKGAAKRVAKKKAE